MLVVKDLSKSYQNKSVVRNVSFNVNPGERLILLGTSGSGKSTILKMINRLVEKDSGLIKFEGEDVSSIEPHILRRRIGYVIQNIGLFPHYSVEKNIGLIPALLNWPLIDKDKRIDELIALVGLDTTFKERMPHELSGGQQQRVGIARALAVNPKLLLMDEPFGALDPITRKEIQEEFVSLNNDQTAVVLVTHDVKEAFLLGDKICLLDQGKIQQLGAPKELLFHPANEFVENFLSDHFIELELSLICMHHLAPFIDRSQPDALTEKIDPTMPISKAMRYASEITFEYENQLLTIHPNQIASLYFNNQNQIRPLL